MSDLPVVIVGAGRLGTAIAWAEARAGSVVHLISRRSSPHAAAAQAEGVHCHVLAEPALDGLPCEAAWFLCVSDAALAEVAAQWGALLQARDGSLAWVAHGSGANDLDALHALPAQGRAVLHPMRALPATPSAEAFTGAPLSVLADSAAAQQMAETHIVRWGAEAIPMADGADRRRYHLACSLAANHLTGLLAWAERLAADSLGPEGARKAVLSLAASALDRIAESGPAEALTGPLARGEAPTLLSHLAALEADAPQGVADAARYRSALRALLDEAQLGQRLDRGQAAELRQQLGLTDSGDSKELP